MKPLLRKVTSSRTVRRLHPVRETESTHVLECGHQYHQREWGLRYAEPKALRCAACVVIGGKVAR